MEATGSLGGGEDANNGALDDGEDIVVVVVMLVDDDGGGRIGEMASSSKSGRRVRGLAGSSAVSEVSSEEEATEDTERIPVSCEEREIRRGRTGEETVSIVSDVGTLRGEAVWLERRLPPWLGRDKFEIAGAARSLAERWIPDV